MFDIYFSFNIVGIMWSVEIGLQATKMKSRYRNLLRDFFVLAVINGKILRGLTLKV